MIFDKSGKQIMSSDVVVTANASNLVTINRSGATFTYDCAPECRSVTSAGDEENYFGQVMSQQQSLQNMNNGN